MYSRYRPAGIYPCCLARILPVGHNPAQDNTQDAHAGIP